MLKRFFSTKSSFYLLLGLSVLILFVNLGLLPLWGSEGRGAVIARSMLQSGDLFSPRLGITDYWDKPLLSYWQILPLSYLCGRVSELTGRFPSAVWAFVMLLLTYRLAKRWFDEPTALLSIGILATTYSFVFWGRIAQVEMPNAAMILLCLWYFLKHKSDNRHTWVYTIGILMALGANMKGLTLYAVPLFCILLQSFIKKDWAWVPSFKVFSTAAVLSLAIFFAIPVAASIRSATYAPLQMVWFENVVRYFGPYDHKDPLYSYFIRIFDLAAPWSLMLPAALIYSLQGIRRRVSQIPEALILFGAIFIFFTLSGSRRPYYLLPILPFAAVLVANVLRKYGLGKPGEGIQRTVRWIGMLLGGSLTIPLLGLLALSLFQNRISFLLSKFPLLLTRILPVYGHVLWFVFILLAFLGIAMIISTKKKYVWGIIGPVFTVWLIYVMVGIPLIAGIPNIKTMTAEVNALGKPYSLLNIDDAKVIFYLDKPSQFFKDKAEASDWAFRTNGILITPPDVSDPSWEAIVKDNHWQAVAPRKTPLLNNSTHLQ